MGMNESNGRPTIVVTAKGYFSELVLEALSQTGVRALPSTELYLTSLLEKYVLVENLFPMAESTNQESPKTLAEMYLKANLSSAALKADLLRRLGDTSLYISGFFGDSLSRKVVDIDYYAQMGGAAYGQLSSYAQEQTARLAYRQLGEEFLRFVEVLTYISQKTGTTGEQNILRLYERYLLSESPLAQRALNESGIFPPVPKGTARKPQ